MLRLSKRLEPSYEYDLIPLIDMLFILLIFLCWRRPLPCGAGGGSAPGPQQQSPVRQGGGAAPGGGRAAFSAKGSPCRAQRFGTGCTKSCADSAVGPVGWCWWPNPRRPWKD